MKSRIPFSIVNRLLMLFLLGILILFTLIFVLIWFFSIDITAGGQGIVKCQNWYDSKPEIKGVIKDMRVKEGDKVEKGELLFTLDDRQQELEVKECLTKIAILRHTIDQSQHRLTMMKQEIDGAIGEAEASLNNAVINYKIILKGAKPEEITIAETRVKRAKRHLAKKLKDHVQMEKAHSLKLISKRELDRVFHEMRLAEIDLQLSQDELALVHNQYDADQIAVAGSEVERLKASLTRALARQNEIYLLNQDLAMTIKSLEKEEKRLVVIEKNLELTNIITPITGQVLTHDTEHLTGKAVSEGEVVLRIGDTTEYIISCKIPERDITLITSGQKAKVAIKPFPKGEYRLFDATVKTVGSDIKHYDLAPGFGVSDMVRGASGVKSGQNEVYYPVILRLEKPYTIYLFGNVYKIKPGFSATVKIVVEQEKIATFLIRKILRIQGKLTPDSIHLH